MCGVLAHFGVTLQRGRFISAGGQLALDVFELSDDEGVLGSVVSAPMELRRLMTARLAETDSHILQREGPGIGKLRDPLVGWTIAVRSQRLDADQHRLCRTTAPPGAPR